MPDEKPKEVIRQNTYDHYWTFFTNHKWIEHQEEVRAWEGHYPSIPKKNMWKRIKIF